MGIEDSEESKEIKKKIESLTLMIDLAKVQKMNFKRKKRDSKTKLMPEFFYALKIYQSLNSRNLIQILIHRLNNLNPKSRMRSRVIPKEIISVKNRF